MRAFEVMIQPVVTVKEHDFVQEVVEKMIQHRLNHLPVVNEQNEILGCVSTENLLKWIGRYHVYYDYYYFSGVYIDQEPLEAKINRLGQQRVSDLVSRKVVTVPMDEEVGEVATLLSKKSTGYVMVESNGVLKGIISPDELIRGLFHKERPYT